jgi:hypothetical protein
MIVTDCILVYAAATVGTKVPYALEHDGRRGRKAGIVVVEAFALMMLLYDHQFGFHNVSVAQL